ncbi:MAG: hypothetical protein NT158_10865 [Cyanobacteria bacterium]|nr:hypothetical protein [Cyanobacteriota bacterium]
MIDRKGEMTRGGFRLLPLLLGVLALLDLRVELILLFDHITWIALAEGLRSHILAVAVLLSLPSLWRRYH